MKAKHVALLLAVVLLFSVAYAEYFYTLFIRNRLVVYGTTELQGATTISSNVSYSEGVAVADTLTLTGNYVIGTTALALSNDSLTLPAGPLVTITGDSGGLAYLTPAGTNYRVVTLTTTDTAEVTIVDGNNLWLTGDANLNASKRSMITLMSYDSLWLEVSRSLH